MSKILKFQSLSNQTIIKRMRIIMFYVSRHLRAEPIQYYIYYVIDLTSDPIVLNVLRIEKEKILFFWNSESVCGR